MLEPSIALRAREGVHSGAVLDVGFVTGSIFQDVVAQIAFPITLVIVFPRHSSGI